MKIKELVKKIDTKNIECLKKDIVKNTYINYELKVADCESIAKQTMYSINGEFKRRSHAQHVLFLLNLLSRYTNIEIDMGNGLDVLASFNELSKNGILELLIEECVPEREYETYKRIFDGVINDIHENERCLTATIERKLSELTGAIEVINEFSNIKEFQNIENLEESNG